MQLATHLVPRQIPAVESVELTFDQRERSRLRATLANGEAIGIQLKVGTMLSHGDKLALQDGRVVEAGPRDAVFAAPTEDYTRRLLAAACLD